MKLFDDPPPPNPHTQDVVRKGERATRDGEPTLAGARKRKDLAFRKRHRARRELGAARPEGGMTSAPCRRTTRAALVARAYVVRAEMNAIFVDAAVYNAHRSARGESLVNPDPDGNLWRELVRLDEWLVQVERLPVDEELPAL